MTNTTNPTKAMELVQLDPKALVIGPNARVDVRIDPQFVADIAEHGVMTPIRAYRDEQGAVTVEQGQRRTRAAIEAGLETVPVLIVEQVTNEAERIIRQVSENDARAAMSGLDRVAVAQDLALLGFSAAQIAKRTRRDRAEVDAALAVSRSEASRARLAQGMDLEAAAAVAEFEGDADAVAAIEQAVEYGRSIEHVVARLRNDREEVAILADAIAKVQQVADVEALPHTWNRDEVAPVAMLRDVDGKPISKTEHLACPGSVAMVKIAHRTDREDGAMPYSVILGCRDYKKHGHRHTHDMPSSNQPKQTKEERAAIIEGNKAWRAAEGVRRAWLAKLCKGAKLPKGGEQFTARALASGLVGDATGWWLLTGRGKIDHWGEDYRTAVASIEKMTPARAAVAALTMCLAEAEKGAANVMTWRNPSTRSAYYLRTLEGWGYPLSEAEEQFCRMTEDTATE